MSHFQPIFATSVGTTPVNVYTVPAGGATIIRLYLTNITASNVLATISYLNPLNGTTLYLAKDLMIPAKNTLEVKPVQPMNEDGLIKVTSSAASSIDVMGSVLPLKKFEPLMVQGLGTTATDLYTAPAEGATLLRVFLANITGADVTASLYYFDASASATIYQVKDVIIPTGNTFVTDPVQRLDAGDILRVISSANNSIDLTGSLTSA